MNDKVKEILKLLNDVLFIGLQNISIYPKYNLNHILLINTMLLFLTLLSWIFRIKYFVNPISAAIAELLLILLNKDYLKGGDSL